MDLDWLSETSLNSLPDIYRLYCKKEPPQDKQLRSIFESGTIEDVRTNFQELFNYCAVDVLMTYEIIQVLWPIFKERFPHPATFCGLLEMSSMYLPINDNWIKFQEKAESSYTENILRQKKLLMQLADQALAKYSNSQEWYRDLIPKPVKDNLDSGPALLTAQMRIAPKLLKLCWQGLPLHYDQVLKWGVLIPGRIPQPYGDPRYYIESFKNTENTECIDSNDAENFSTNSNVVCHYDSSIRPIIPVVKSTAAGDETLDFPYGAYLNYWLADVKRRLLADFQLNESTSSCDNFSDSLAVAYSHRIKPDIRDANLLDELKRSIEIMPLEKEERQRLASTISTIRKLGEQKRFQMDSKLQKIKNNAQGSAFWLNSNRFDQNSSNYSNYRRRNAVRYAVDTVNPVIPTCWFKHLPHESGTGLPVGSPLSRSFQSHIASHRLHSADFNPNDTISANTDTIKLKPVMGLADRLLHDRVHATFWQSYSKRIKSQMAIWLPHDQLPKNVLNDQSYNCKANYGAILPQVITCGTVSRRAVEPLWLTASNADENRLGSEIKAMVQSPPGYVFVGADVDSQEMWIAALIGDAGVGFQGSTPYGWMTLQGNKLDGTDLHTKIAKEMGIKRSESKVLNYSRLYGSGIEFASHLLAKFCNITVKQASLKAKQLFQITKGRRTIVDSFPSDDGTSISTSKWQGGSESAVFNQLESIARSPEPRTPFLNAQLTRALNPKLVKDDFLPSRVNWVVQSSAVDYLHCMLVLMRWLINKFKIPARLCISIHDELRYICPKSHMYQVALALQISNLLTRTFFVYQLGMRDLPESVAFFSSVEVDTCIRKEAKDDCVTPSNSSGLQNGYGVSPGQSLTMQDILDKTGGSMKL
ncbi:putative DNA polymerase gamma [Schistosoma mansoni]|uniref:putative DNA polymerase gamma n=1 Tax=Schistosoma mansoni TaxID=6183 RepID=UPI00022DC749|nr:putative DNA polymerase gamma [Schistosoma mansoni]|eukprot:XP_018649151.1 putative DNA polymerase gamma [Schistosoma mansoni]